METKTEQFGIHLMIDGYGASIETLKDKDTLRQMLIDLPKVMKMHTISDPLVVEVGPQNRKDPGDLVDLFLSQKVTLVFIRSRNVVL